MDISKRLKTYQEALIVLALRRFREESEVGWNRRIGPVFIDPDVTVGPDARRPEAIVCVAHSDSEKESDKKFWRNAAELALSKVHLTPRPTVLSVIFEQAYKPKLITAMDEMFDGQALLVRDLSALRLVDIGPTLTRGPLVRKSKDQVLEYLQEMLERDRALCGEFKRLSGWLKQKLQAKPLRHESYWNGLAGRVRRHRRTPHEEARPEAVSFRRGVSKLMCFKPDDRMRVLEMARDGRSGQLEPFALGLGWVRPRLNRSVQISDPDIRGIAGAFSPETIMTAVATIDPKVLRGLNRVGCDPCRRSGEEAASIAQFYIANRAEWSAPASMARLLNRCFADPSFGGAVDVTRPWMIEFCLAAGKAVAERAQGYGLAKLANEIAVPEPHRVRFWVPKYSSGEANLPSFATAEVARALSKQCASLQAKHGDAGAEGSAVLRWMAHTLVEVRLCTYRLFKPAELLVSAAARRAGIAVANGKLSTSEVFGGGTAVGGTEGLCLSLGRRRVFAKVQSGAKNPHDKAKELAGRRGLSEGENGAGKYHRTVLILDGPFEREHIALCRAAGWDEVLFVESLREEYLSRLFE